MKTPDSTRTPELQQAEQLRLLRFNRFADDRKKLARLTAENAIGQARLAELEKADFPTQRREMRWALFSCLSLSVVVFMAASIEAVILQEFSRELAVSIKRGLANEIEWLPAGRINQIMTLLLIASFVAALLITKSLTNSAPDIVAWRSCPLALRRGHFYRVALKASGKIVYLSLLATMFYQIHLRQLRAAEYHDKILNVAPGVATQTVFGNLNAPATTTPVPGAQAQKPFSGYTALYCLDLMLHALVLFGLQSVTAKGIDLRDVFSNPTRLRRRITGIKNDQIQVANRIAAQVNSSGIDAEERQGYLDLLTESERATINDLYGRQQIADKVATIEFPVTGEQRCGVA